MSHYYLQSGMMVPKHPLLPPFLVKTLEMLDPASQLTDYFNWSPAGDSVVITQVCSRGICFSGTGDLAKFADT
jgi:hypothetical protein